MRFPSRARSWPAGGPIEAVEVSESFEVPSLLRSDRPCFALWVRGDSMVGDGILDGDIVIVEPREEARDGEIVVAVGRWRRRRRSSGFRTIEGAARRHRAPALQPADGGPSLCARPGAGDGGLDRADAKLSLYR